MNFLSKLLQNKDKLQRSDSIEKSPKPAKESTKEFLSSTSSVNVAAKLVSNNDIVKLLFSELFCICEIKLSKDYLVQYPDLLSTLTVGYDVYFDRLCQAIGYASKPFPKYFIDYIKNWQLEKVSLNNLQGIQVYAVRFILCRVLFEIISKSTLSDKQANKISEMLFLYLRMAEW